MKLDQTSVNIHSSITFHKCHLLPGIKKEIKGSAVYEDLKSSHNDYVRIPDILVLDIISLIRHIIYKITATNMKFLLMQIQILHVRTTM